MQIAINTCQREVLEIIGAAVNPRDDVLDMKRRQRRVVLVQPAILTAMASTIPDAGSRVGAHRSRCGTDNLPCLALQDGNELVRSDVPRVLGLLRVGELAFG